MLFLSMQEVRKLHLPIKIQSISKVFVILEHVSMKNNRRPRWQEACFFLWQTSFGFRAWILQQLVLYSNSTSDLYEAKIFTRNNISILKNHLKNSVCFFLHLLFCNEAQNYKIDIFVALFWKSSTCSDFFFHRKQEVAIIIISSVLVFMNINANLFSFLWSLYSRRPGNYLAKAAWDQHCHFSLLAVLKEKRSKSLNLEKEKVNLWTLNLQAGILVFIVTLLCLIVGKMVGMREGLGVAWG